MKFKKENEMTIKEKIERIENKIDSENKDNILVFYSIFIWDMYLNRMNSVFQCVLQLFLLLNCRLDF